MVEKADLYDQSPLARPKLTALVDFLGREIARLERAAKDGGGD
jgi:hypothetical protein